MKPNTQATKENATWTSLKVKENLYFTENRHPYIGRKYLEVKTDNIRNQAIQETNESQ